jgi:hypothetical protein
MTGSLIFTIKAIKGLPEAAIHTPIKFLQIHVDFLNSNYPSFVLRPKKKKLMSNNLQAKLILKLFNSVYNYEPVNVQIV